MVFELVLMPTASIFGICKYYIIKPSSQYQNADIYGIGEWLKIGYF